MKKILLILLFFLTSCSQPKFENKQSLELINLLDSIKIIRTVICQNKLSELLEQHTPEELELLINNFSPAQMAFEAEVLSTTIPLVVVYYFKNTVQEKEFINKLNKLALEYNNKVKFVIIDSDKLFSLAQNAEINEFPSVIFSKNKKIIEKISKDITIDLIIKIISNQ